MRLKEEAEILLIKKSRQMNEAVRSAGGCVRVVGDVTTSLSLGREEETSGCHRPLAGSSSLPGGRRVPRCCCCYIQTADIWERVWAQTHSLIATPLLSWVCYNPHWLAIASFTDKIYMYVCVFPLNIELRFHCTWNGANLNIVIIKKTKQKSLKQTAKISVGTRLDQNHSHWC